MCRFAVGDHRGTVRIRTAIVDPYLELAQSWGYQELQPHQAAVIDRSAALVESIK